MGFEKKQFTTEVGGKPLVLEVSSIAEHTNAAVLAKYGDTVVLVTVVMGKKEATVDYLPLKVDYEERFYAAGKIIGSRFIRREGRPSEEAILSGRLVDRVLRPLFDQYLRHDVQVVVTVLAIDEANDPDFVGLIGASAALAISDVPWKGPVAGVRIAKINGTFVVNPNLPEIQKPECAFETFVAGVKGKINMIELGGKEAPESEIKEAFILAQKEIDKLIAFQEGVVKEIGRPQAEAFFFQIDPALRTAAETFLSTRLEEAIYHPLKMEREDRLRKLKRELIEHLAEKLEKPDPKATEFVFDELIDQIVHKNVLEKDRRPDDRGLKEVRELKGEIALFERTHGSALFTRGSTQSLSVTTLAAPGAEQIIETMETTGRRRFMLHYNFPPYSVGEIGTFRGPGRREIGHGALAEKAVRPLIPSKEEFPYTIRVVSEILSSNGSSSMATVCATILSLLDAGVPLKKMAAGIAMGMMSDEKGNHKILTDIQGPEDHYGDMDFKVAGTTDGVTAMQMDVKTDGFSVDIIEKVMLQAKEARLEILKFLETVISTPRPRISKYAPAVSIIKINPEKIGLVIGPGGKTINGMIAKFGLGSIDIEEDGSVAVSGTDLDKVALAVAEIQAMTKEFKAGEMVEGTVVRILDFGAIVDIGGGRDGMIHVSELKEGFVKTVTEVVKLGDFVKAKIIRVDADGHIGLSLKQV